MAVRAITAFLILLTASHGEGLDPALVPGAKPVAFSAVSKYAVAGLGDMRLSETKLSFSKLKGFMSLRYDSTLPCNGWDGLSCARIYQVLNGAAYYAKNKKKGEPCADAPSWVAIAPVPPFGSTPDTYEIWVSVFDIADIHAYTPDKFGICGSNVFSRD